jgi:hypothetical protein
VTKLTEGLGREALNQRQRLERCPIAKGHSMLTAILITLLIVAALGYSLASSRAGESIVRRPYNNRYNDASGAREDNFT